MATPTVHTYRQMVTVDGHYLPAEILRHAHRKARTAFNAQLCFEAGLTLPRGVAPGEFSAWYAKAAATIDRSKIKSPISYARFFKEELTQAYRWAKAIRGAGQGEAPARAVPMFQMSEAA